ncbi:histidine kinase [Nonomuraea maritima]|uniref:histidine kinase n=1 Tax=Nonomuraea maritima TaxID=683260 RepID=UPI003712C958
MAWSAAIWTEPDDPGGRRGRWIFPAVAYGLLAVGLVGAWATGRLTAEAVWIAVPAAVWVASLVWIYPRRAERRGLAVLHYAGLLVLGGALVTVSSFFTMFLSVAYPMAGAMLPRRGMMAGVAATAIVMVVAQTGPGALGAGQVNLVVPLLGIALPMLFAGWQLTAESERRHRTNVRLQAALEENAGLHAQLVVQAREAGVLDERQRLAREIHDTIAQDLVALVTQVRAATGADDDPELRRRHLDNVAVLADRALTEARRSVRALRPAPLLDARLPDALAEMAARWGESSGVVPEVEVTGTPRVLASAVEVTLFRVAQEALSNIARHAGSRRVGVTLSYLDDTVLLDVRDDGTGFDPAAGGSRGGGYGLDTMAQRVRGVGGTLSVESAPGQGTAVAAAVPAIPADPGGTEEAT